jgi:hypothetical protein
MPAPGAGTQTSLDASVAALSSRCSAESRPRGSAWCGCRRRNALSCQNTTGCPSSSDASRGRAPSWRSWSKTARFAENRCAASVPRRPVDGHCPPWDRPARSARTAPTTEPRAPSRPEMPPAASSWRSAQTPPSPASAASSPQPMRTNSPRCALYHDHQPTLCRGSLAGTRRLWYGR